MSGNSLDNVAKLREGAALLKYTPAGTGAVATTVQAKLREFVSVKDFGAVGDGVADDTAAIQSAVDTVGAAGGGSVYFPPGTYLVGNGNPGASNWDNRVAIWVLYSNVRLIGAGAGATKILLKANANAHVIKFGQREGGTVTVSHGGVYDMEIVGNRVNQVTPTATADHQQGIDLLQGIIARSNGQAGIVYDAVNEITVIGADVRSNAIGHDIRADSSNIRIIGGSCTGNTTAFINSGSSIAVASVSGFRTYSTVVGVAAIDSTGLKTVTIPHTLAVTPSTKDVSVTLRRNTNVGDWVCGFYNVVSCDATNVVIQLRVTAASATAGAVVDVIATVNTLATM